jgi:hypothetical protein
MCLIEIEVEIKICMINERGMVEGLLRFCVKRKYENVVTGVWRV